MYARLRCPCEGLVRIDRIARAADAAIAAGLAGIVDVHQLAGALGADRSQRSCVHPSDGVEQKANVVIVSDNHTRIVHAVGCRVGHSHWMRERGEMMRNGVVDEAMISTKRGILATNI